jgi:hypothetical protein
LNRLGVERSAQPETHDIGRYGVKQGKPGAGL